MQGNFGGDTYDSPSALAACYETSASPCSARSAAKPTMRPSHLVAASAHHARPSACSPRTTTPRRYVAPGGGSARITLPTPLPHRNSSLSQLRKTACLLARLPASLQTPSTPHLLVIAPHVIADSRSRGSPSNRLRFRPSPRPSHSCGTPNPALPRKNHPRLIPRPRPSPCFSGHFSHDKFLTVGFRVHLAATMVKQNPRRSSLRNATQGC